MSVVDAVAIEVFLDAQAECADREQAEAQLVRALAAARGPRTSLAGGPAKSWRLDMSVSAAAPGIRSADARIIDDSARIVSERSLSDRTNGSCLALARAVGAWAQIVLDEELVRAHEEADRQPADKPGRSRPHEDAGPLSEHQPIRLSRSLPTSPESDAPPLEAPRSPTPPRTFEVGTTMFLRNGGSQKGGVFGASPFVTIGVSGTWLLRPSLMVGTSTSKVPPDGSARSNFTALGGRVDFCKRLPGNYIDHRGIELDICAGTDMFHLWTDREKALRMSVGPSAVLRGELGANFGLEIRGMLGANLVRGSLGTDDAPFFVAACELGGSVRFQ